MAKIKALAEIVEGLKAKVYTFDNLSPVSRVSVYVKAGSRYEPDAVPGIAHYLKASAGMTTEASSQFGFVRHLERASAKFSVTLEREYLVYRVECLRDKLGFALQFIDHQLHRPEYRPWELFDTVVPRLAEEVKHLRSNQSVLANETLHKAAYRGGLAHSTIIPEHQIRLIKREHLFDYLDKNVVPSRISIIGLGVANSDLSTCIENHFRFTESDYKGVSGKSRYVGGEFRMQAGFPETLVNYVVEGFPTADFKSVAALEVLANILGGHQQKYIKYGNGGNKSLSNLLISHNLGSVKPNIININHSDTGLFGISLKGSNVHIGKATKLALKHVKEVLSSLKESDLKVAKEVTIKRTLVSSENHDEAYKAMSKRCVVGLENIDPIEVVSSLTMADLQTVASKLSKGKPTLVSIGNPRYVPYLDEIDS